MSPRGDASLPYHVQSMGSSVPGLDIRVLGRYALYSEIASGGMASVHIGRLMGPVGFSKTVAIKRMHPQFAKDPEFVSMFLDEARLAARIRHPNVVSTLDIVATDGELFLVMEYIEGESLARLRTALRHDNAKLAPAQAVSILAGALHGLHAAHEARNERGEPLDIVHRDISPQNVLVGIDGIPRVLDFGVAKATGRAQTTRDGRLKGKMAYMAPEQLESRKVDRRTDVWAAGVVLWEALTMRRLFKGDNDVEVFGKVLRSEIPAPSTIASDVPAALDRVVLKSLERNPEDRFATAREMARALEACTPSIAAADLGEFVSTIARTHLEARAKLVAAIESGQVTSEKSDVSESEPAPKEKEATVTHLEGVTDAAEPPSRHRRTLQIAVGGAVALGAFALIVKASTSSAPAPRPVASEPPAPREVAAIVSSSPAASSVEETHAAPPASSVRVAAPTKTAKTATTKTPCTPHDFSYPDCLKK
jgi:serine/threonine-protein kinase